MGTGLERNGEHDVEYEFETLPALTGIACGGPVADAEAYADAVCDCEDKECVDKLKEYFEKKAEENKTAHLSDEDKTPSTRQMSGSRIV